MKKVIFLLFVLMTTLALESNAQAKVDAESCLLKAYKQSELNAMSAEELAYQTFYVENIMLVMPVPEGKPTDIYPHKNWVVDENTCVYDLKVKSKPNERVYFFSNNNNLVMLYSERELKKNYEKNK